VTAESFASYFGYYNSQWQTEACTDADMSENCAQTYIGMTITSTDTQTDFFGMFVCKLSCCAPFFIHRLGLWVYPFNEMDNEA